MLSALAITALAMSAVSLAAVMALSRTAAPLATRDSTWSAKLTAAQEVPRQSSKDASAHGTFTGALNHNMLKFTLTFSGLTGKVTSTYIHLGAMGKAGDVVVPICTPCTSPVAGTVSVSRSVQKDFAEHLLYVNVHTVKNPAGEIRGQLGT